MLFQQLRSESEDIFYLSPDSKETMTMMRSRGMYRTASFDDMKMDAIELCYEVYELLYFIYKIFEFLLDIK